MTSRIQKMSNIVDFKSYRDLFNLDKSIYGDDAPEIDLLINDITERYATNMIDTLSFSFECHPNDAKRLTDDIEIMCKAYCDIYHQLLSDLTSKTVELHFLKKHMNL